jgi:AMP-binding enzyme
MSGHVPADATLGRQHLAVERIHDRASVFRWRVDGRWQETPDWRFHRQIVRIGIYLGERVGLVPGDRVAIVSALRPEVLVAEWATVASGATSVVVDPDLPDAVFDGVMNEVAPRVVFVSQPADLARLLETSRAPASPTAIVTLDDDVSSPRAMSWQEVLDLGGTLDTAERAQAFRALARGVSPDAPALAGVSLSSWGAAPGGSGLRPITHRQAAIHLQGLRLKSPARKGDVAYVAAGPLSIAARLSLVAFAGDGLTTTALGSPGREAEEIAALRPRHVISGFRCEGGSP